MKYVMGHQSDCPVNNEPAIPAGDCTCPFGKINEPLRLELDDYIAGQEEKSRLSVYQLETALRNLERNRFACTDPLMGGKRATLNQSIYYFKELLRVRREDLGAKNPAMVPPTTEETKQ